jgi:hypothetical protein
MKLINAFTFAAGIALLFSGCAGPAGPEGQLGPAGSNGQNGTNGAANISISVYSVPLGSWVLNASPAYYYASFADTAITDSVQEGIEAFFSISSTGPWQALPAINVFNTGDEITYSWTNNKIQFEYDYTSLNNFPPNIYYNVAVIPPTIMKRYPGTNWKDGKAVLKIPEVEAALKTGKN